MPQQNRRRSAGKKREKPLALQKYLAKSKVWRESLGANILVSALVPFFVLFIMEWVARGTLAANTQYNGFFQSFFRHFPSFFFAYLLLVSVYVFLTRITGYYAVATGILSVCTLVPAVVNHYKLTMRGEPFLPWDLRQIDDLVAAGDSVHFTIHAVVVVGILLLAVLSLASGLLAAVPRNADGKPKWRNNLIASGLCLIFSLGLVFGLFLNPAATAAIGIKEDMWMQDRYYRKHGLITGFLTNLQLLRIQAPNNYSISVAEQIALEALMDDAGAAPLFPGSYGATQALLQEQPDIIFLMAESFWDVTSLPGIAYDQDVLENYNQLSAEAAHGFVYSPSFGGGTCDVEFEALTGFSMEHLPSGSKPFQQYVVDDMFSLPSYLKTEGYETLAIHSYGRRFWSRDTAYPRLGIDTFIASEDFVQPERRRGFISDNAMVDRIIEEYEARAEGGPMFIHAVTMQNHTTYDRSRYPESELVRVTDYPTELPDNIIGQLEDCATGIRDMDAALGKLTNYLRESDRPTILVFWGDHMNPMSDGYGLFETTGFIEEGDSGSPKLRQTPMMIWSNYDDASIDLGVIASYNLTAVMMELYGLDKPPVFALLAQQLTVYRARTRGVTVNTNGSYSDTMTPEQEAAYNRHAILQYYYMFDSNGPVDYTTSAAFASG